jgi:hypothetical protein
MTPQSLSIGMDPRLDELRRLALNPALFDGGEAGHLQEKPARIGS